MSEAVIRRLAVRRLRPPTDREVFAALFAAVIFLNVGWIAMQVFARGRWWLAFALLPWTFLYMVFRRLREMWRQGERAGTAMRVRPREWATLAVQWLVVISLWATL